MAKRFSRSTRGANLQTFVASPIAFTTDTTFDAFVANAVQGELGVFDAAGALHTNAIVAGEEFFIAQKVTGGVKVSQRLKFGEFTARKIAYRAAVKQVTTVGWGGTGGALNLAAAPVAGDSYGLTILETTEGTQPFPTWSYSYTAKAGDAEIDVVLALAKQINTYNSLQNKNSNPIVGAKVKADATYGNFAIGAGGTLTVTNGSNVVTTAVGTINFTIGAYVSFDAGAAPTDAIGDIYKVVGNPDANTWLLDRAYAGATQTFIEAEAEGTRVKAVTVFVETGLAITALNDNEHFKVAVREGLIDSTQATSGYVRGNGSPTQVSAFEEEGTTFAGETTKNTEFDAKFGKQDRFTLPTDTYDMYQFDYGKPSDAVGPTPLLLKGGLFVANPLSAGDNGTELDTIFGL